MHYRPASPFPPFVSHSVCIILHSVSRSDFRDTRIDSDSHLDGKNGNEQCVWLILFSQFTYRNFVVCSVLFFSRADGIGFFFAAVTRCILNSDGHKWHARSHTQRKLFPWRLLQNRVAINASKLWNEIDFISNPMAWRADHRNIIYWKRFFVRIKGATNQLNHSKIKSKRQLNESFHAERRNVSCSFARESDAHPIGSLMNTQREWWPTVLMSSYHFVDVSLFRFVHRRTQFSVFVDMTMMMMCGTQRSFRCISFARMDRISDREKEEVV